MEPQGKAYERVIRYIKDEILKGDLQQGQKLPPERDLAELLGVGRNSVREALRTLSIIGVISSTQGAGNYVSCNFEKSLVEMMTMMFLLQKINYRQISELRQGIETQAALLAIGRIDEQGLCELEQIVEELNSGSAEEQNVILDKKLHYKLAQASQNQMLVEILQALSDVMDLFISDLRRQILVSEGSRQRLTQAHRDIVKGLRHGDKELVASAMAEHFHLIEEHL